MNKNTLPVIALTMGDPAGIGPEITLEALLSPEVHGVCRPFIIGSAQMLARTARAAHREVSFRPIRSVKDAEYRFGVIDVLETGEYDVDAIQWGEVQQPAGQMSLDFIYKSIALGMKGEIDAVATAPINKSAIKLAGEKEAGHTEIYQRETGSAYALTMFACHKLRVFFRKPPPFAYRRLPLRHKGAGFRLPFDHREGA